MPKISELTAATTITGTDTLAIVQGGDTKKLAASALSQLFDIRQYGAVSGGPDCLAAFNSAISAAAANGGGEIRVPAGIWTVSGTVTVNADRITIVGEGPNATRIKFDPASPAVLFDFNRGANSIVQAGIRNVGFTSANTTTKTAIRIHDGRHCVIEDIGISQGAWPGAGSIGIHTLGRDTLSVARLAMICARPIVIGANPNYNTLNTDHFHFMDCEIGTTETEGKVIDIASGVNISNLTFDGYQAWLLGKHGLFWDDSSSTLDSYNLAVTGVRVEQASDSTGYSVYLKAAGSGIDLKTVRFEQCYFDLGRNGVYLRDSEKVSFTDCFFAGTTGRTNLNITFGSRTELLLDNTFVNTGSTVTLTNAVACVEMPWGSGSHAISPTGYWRYEESSLTARRARREDGVLSFKWKGTLANVAQLNLPVLSSGGADVAVVRFAAGHATGPILEGGTAIWRPGSVALAGVTSNVVTSSTADKLAIIDNTNALSIVNRLGQTVDLVVDVTWSD
jgi:hypothetical protein